MVDFARENEVLDRLGINCKVSVVMDPSLGGDVVYDPLKGEADIYVGSFTDFVEAAGRLRLGIDRHPLFATPVFSPSLSYDEKRVAAKLMKFWTPLLGGWGWKEVTSFLEGSMLEELKKELRLELDTMAIKRMMGEGKYGPVRMLRKQVGYYVLGGSFAVRVRSGESEKYKLYVEKLFEYVEEEPSFELLEEIGKIILPDIDLDFDPDQSVIVLKL